MKQRGKDVVIVTEFEIDQFRGRNPLRLLDLGNGLNVALVRNRADKTAMLSVVPYVLYGTDADAASPWVDAIGTDASIDVQTENGVFHIDRTIDEPEDVLIRSPDGMALEPSYLETLVDGVGPATFFRIFTLNARVLRRKLDRRHRSVISEIEQMATFLRDASPQPDTQPPQVSLEPLQQLDECVEQLTNAVSSQVDVQRSQLTALGELPNREQLTEEIARIEQELSDVQAKEQHARQESEETRLAIRFQEMRSRLAALEKDLSTLREAPTKRERSDSHAAAVTEIDEKLTRCRERLEQLREQKRAAEEELADNERAERIRRLIPRIQAVLLQEKFLAAEEQSIEQLADSIRDLESRLETDRLQAEAMAAEMALEAEKAAQSLGEIDRLASHLRETKRHYRLARNRKRVGEPETSPDIGAAPLKADRRAAEPRVPIQHGDTEEIRAADDRVKQLRERVHVDRRLEDLYGEREETDQQLRRLYSQQLPPLPVLMFLSLPFMIGAAMILSGFYNSDPTNWQRVGLGMLVLAVTALIKVSTDNVNGDELRVTRGQLAEVDREIEAALDFRNRFDDGWPDTVTPWREQLEIAKRDVETLRNQSGKRKRDRGTPAKPGSTAKTHLIINPRSKVLTRRAHEARRRHSDALARWREKLAELGLPTELSPSQARLAVEQKIIDAQSAANLPGSALEFQLRQLRNDLDRRRQGLAEMMSQSRQLVQELGYSLKGTTSGEQMEILRETMQEHQEEEQNRQELDATLRELTRREQKLQRYKRGLQGERRELMETREQKQNAERSKQQLRAERVRLLEREHDQLVLQIDELKLQDGDDAAAAALSALAADQLAARLRDLHSQQVSCQTEIVNLVDGRARCHERLKHIDELEELAKPATAWSDVLAVARDFSQRWHESSTQQKEQTETLAAQVRMAESYKYLHVAAENSSALANFAVDLSFDDHGNLRSLGKSGKWSAIRRLRRHRLAQLYIGLWLSMHSAVRGLRRETAGHPGRCPLARVT